MARPRAQQGTTEDKMMSCIGGVNLLTDPLRIDDSEAVRLKNLYPANDGKLALRKGSVFVCPDVALDGIDTTTATPVNFLVPKFDPGLYVMALFFSDPGAHYLHMGHTSYLDGSLSTEMALGNPGSPAQSYRPAMLEYGKRILVLSGVPVIDVGGPNDGGCVYECTAPLDVPTIALAPVRFTGLAGEFVAPKIIFVYQGRVVYGNFGPGLEDTFIFADPGDQPYKVNAGASTTVDVTRTGGRSLQLLGLKGDASMAGIEISVKSAGAPDASAMFVMGSETAILCPGTPLVTDAVPAAGETYSGTLSPQTINYPCGCVSPDTLVKTPMGILWASWNDVWALDIGGMPRRVGTKIRPVLTDGPASMRFAWHAAYHHGTGSYRLAVVAPDQAFDPGVITKPCKDQWWLDLRGGIPQESSSARWYGPQQYRMATVAEATSTLFGTFMMHTVEVAGESSRLLACHVVARVIPGFYFAQSPCIVEMDQQVGRDNAVPVAPDLTTFNGAANLEILPSQQLNNEIVYEIVSKQYDFGDATKDKLFQSLDLSIWASDLLTVECMCIVDGGRDFHTMHIEPDQLGFAGGVGAADSDRLTHQYQAISFKPVDGARLTGKVFQFRLKNAYTGTSGHENTMGWPVPENGANSQIYISGDPSGGGTGVYFAVDIPPGFYQSRTTFLAALIAAMNTNTLPWLGQAVTFGSHVITGVTTLQPIEITNGNATAVWNWLVNTAGSTGEVLKSLLRSKKVAAMLGFRDPSDFVIASVLDGFLGQSMTALDNVPLTVTAHVEIVAAKISVYHFERRPSGGKYEPNIP